MTKETVKSAFDDHANVVVLDEDVVVLDEVFQRLVFGNAWVRPTRRVAFSAEREATAYTLPNEIRTCWIPACAGMTVMGLAWLRQLSAQ